MPDPAESSTARRPSLIVKKGEKKVAHVNPVDFAEAGIREVQHLQEWMLARIEILGDLKVLDDQYVFERARDRLDILCVDREAHPVIVELKRTSSADYADLQSLRYAAMLSEFKLDDAAERLSQSRQGKEKGLSKEAARQEIEDFIQGEEGPSDSPELQSEPRIIIASPGFSDEVLKTAQFLHAHKIQVTCIRLSAYPLGEDRFILVPDVVHPPPKPIESYVRRVEEKREARQSADRTPVDHAWWETASSRESMLVVDALLKMFRESDGQTELRYFHAYIRPQRGPGHRLRIWIHPEREPLRVDVDLVDPQRATEWREKLELAGIKADSNRPGAVRFELTPESLERNAGIVREILDEASKGD